MEAIDTPAPPPSYLALCISSWWLLLSCILYNKPEKQQNDLLCFVSCYSKTKHEMKGRRLVGVGAPDFVAKLDRVWGKLGTQILPWVLWD